MAERCVVCESQIQREAGSLVFSYEGESFDFCSLDCLKIFQAYPAAYANAEEPELSTVEDSQF